MRCEKENRKQRNLDELPLIKSKFKRNFKITEEMKLSIFEKMNKFNTQLDKKTQKKVKLFYIC